MASIDISRYEKKKAPKSPDDSGAGSFMAFMNKDITFGKNELSDKKKESMYLEMSSLLLAGISLKSSLELLTSEQGNAKDKLFFEAIQQRVLQGTSLSNSMAQSNKFSSYEVFSIGIGEETGKLTGVLQELAKFYQNKIKQRRKIISALTYPSVVLMTSLGAVFFMLKFVVPMFGDVFKVTGGKLPWITEEIIGLSKGMEDNFYWFLLVIAGLITGWWFVHKSDRYRDLVSRLVLKIPVAGNLVRKIYLARFCNSMQLLINAKLPLLRAIALSRQMAGWYPLEHSLKQVEEDILKGQPLHQSLKRFPVYPSKMIQFIKIGEESNQLDYFFAKIADQYVEEVEYKTESLTGIMQPLITLILGVIVGTIMIAMYLPMFQMSSNIQ